MALENTLRKNLLSSWDEFITLPEYWNMCQNINKNKQDVFVKHWCSSNNKVHNWLILEQL